METPSQNIPIEELLAHEDWLRRVVVDLIDDRHVEDVLQETWVAALAARRIVHPRAWLGRVAANLARSRIRAEARRRRRESAVAKDEALPSTEAIVARLHAHRRLAAAAAELDEPYRTAVLLRYFEDLPPREIARWLGMPASTVRTHIERGLRRIRDRLGSDDEVRALAVLVLTPRVGEPIAPPTWTGRVVESVGGVVAVVSHSKVWTSVVVATLLVSTTTVWWKGRAAIEPDPADVTPSLVMARDVVDARAEVADPGVERSDVSVRPTAAAAAPFVGRVVDARGNPVAGVELEFRPTSHEVSSTMVSGVVPAGAEDAVELGASDALGRFVWASDASSGQLHVRAPFLTVRFEVPERTERAAMPALVVVARRATVRGRVVDETGAPLANVLVLPRVAPLLSYPEPLDRARTLGLASVITGADGTFELVDVPHLPELEAQFQNAGYITATQRSLASTRDLLLTLRAKAAHEDGFAVRGMVVDAKLRPVRGATVLLGTKLGSSGRDGRFELRTRSLDRASPFGAALPGFIPAVQPDVVASLLAGELVGDVVLQLGGPARAIVGRVVDPDGEPIEGVTACILDGTQLDAFATLEDFVGGRDVQLESTHGFAMKVDARSDADGAFSILGLFDRTYRLRVFDPSTLVGRTTEVLAGGDQVTIVLDRKTKRTFRGLVRSRAGSPLAGISVGWQLTTYANSGMSLIALGGYVETDAAGRFELTGIPLEGVDLAVSGRDIVTTKLPLDGLDPSTELLLEPERLCRVRVQLIASIGNRVQFLDAANRALDLVHSSGPISHSGDGWSLDAGRTPTLEVSGAAHWLVVLRDGVELVRHQIGLRGVGVEMLVF